VRKSSAFPPKDVSWSEEPVSWLLDHPTCGAFLEVENMFVSSGSCRVRSQLQ